MVTGVATRTGTRTRVVTVEGPDTVAPTFPDNVSTQGPTIVHTRCDFGGLLCLNEDQRVPTPTQDW